MEVASHITGIVDYAEKRADYTGSVVGEYWWFDPKEGAYYDYALAIDWLVGGRHERIAIEWLDAEHGRGYSEALGLYVCWERELLLFFDPFEGRHLRGLSESAAERQVAVS